VEFPIPEKPTPDRRCGIVLDDGEFSCGWRLMGVPTIEMDPDA
jgi:hypothetical protein